MSREDRGPPCRHFAGGAPCPPCRKCIRETVLGLFPDGAAQPTARPRTVEDQILALLRAHASHELAVAQHPAKLAAQAAKLREHERDHRAEYRAALRRWGALEKARLSGRPVSK